MRKILFAILLSVSLCGLMYAQQPNNITQIAGSNIATAASGIAKVGLTDGTGTALTSTGSALDVNLKTSSITLNVSAAQSGNWTSRIVGNAGATMDVAIGGATAATDALQVGGVFNTVLPTLTNGQGGAIQLDSSGRVLINCATGCSAGSTTQLVPGTTGGVTVSHLLAAASNNATSLKASAGQLYGACVYNNTTYPVYLKFYNKATSPTPASDTVVFSVQAQAGVRTCFNSEQGAAFGTGIAYAVVKGISDTDNTSLVASDAVIDLIYK